MVEFLTIFYKFFYTACLITSNVLLYMYFFLVLLTMRKRMKEIKQENKIITNDFINFKLNKLLICSYIISTIESLINPEQKEGFLSNIIFYLLLSIVFYLFYRLQLNNYKKDNKNSLNYFFEKYRNFLNLN